MGEKFLIVIILGLVFMNVIFGVILFIFSILMVVVIFEFNVVLFTIVRIISLYVVCVLRLREFVIRICLFCVILKVLFILLLIIEYLIGFGFLVVIVNIRVFFVVFFVIFLE